MPGDDACVELQYLSLQPFDCQEQQGTRVRLPGVRLDPQRLPAVARRPGAEGGDDPEFGKIRECRTGSPFADTSWS